MDAEIKSCMFNMYRCVTVEKKTCLSNYGSFKCYVTRGGGVGGCKIPRHKSVT